MHLADLLGIPLLLASAWRRCWPACAAAARPTRRCSTRTAMPWRACSARGWGAASPPADGRWHRVLRETHRRETGRPHAPVWLVSEFWLVDSEGRQWHVALRCQPAGWCRNRG
jgi:hypothetical protein